MESIRTNCCIVGGGPAGMVLGYLLARAGIEVTVLEKHKDFFRDFRGDTIHPATMEMMYQLGLLDDFLKLPHQKIEALSGVFGGKVFPIAEFYGMRAHAPYVALMPQWDFLNFLAERAKALPSFTLRMEHEVVGLLEDGNRISGVRAKTPAGPLEIRAGLVIGCDGRSSTARACGHLKVLDKGVPIDVLWFRLSRRPGDPENALGNINYGKMLILINRGDYFQCGYIIAKGSFETKIRPAGLQAFQDSILQLIPFMADRVSELVDWEQIKLLSVQVNRLQRWHRPGLLCIGDAAHAMSPVGGIGINIAIQDAVATARILTGPLNSGLVTEFALGHVQSRRALPVKITQVFQILVHRFLTSFLGDPRPLKPPFLLRLLSPHAFFRRLVARFIGMGIRPEPASMTHR